MASNKRKISTGSELQPIIEDKEMIDKFEKNIFTVTDTPPPNSQKTPLKVDNRPPQVPHKNEAVDQHINYVNDALLWLRTELEMLKKEDRNLMFFYKNLRTTANNLKRVTTTFQEQSAELERMDNLNETPDICDLPSNNNNTNYEQRYRRVSMKDRLCSYS